MKYFVFFLLLSCVGFKSDAQKMDYAQAYRQLSDSIQHYFYNAGNDFYKEQLPPGPKERQASYLWPLCALLEGYQTGGVLNGDFKDFERVAAIIKKYHTNKPPAPGFASFPMIYGGGDRFYDDNQWIGITAMNQYGFTHDKTWLEQGIEIYNFMMTGFDTVSGGGLYWQEGIKKSKNTCSNGPGILLALQLYKATKEQQYLNVARGLYTWVNAHLRSPEGLFYDNLRIKNGTVDTHLYSYNTGTMLQSAIILYEITKDNKYLQEAKTTANAAASYFLAEGKFRDNYWFNAVLLRAYQDLLRYDKNTWYLQLFQKAVETAAAEKDAHGLWGTAATKNLVPQGGMLELLARLALLQKQGVLQ
ncbi:MAG: AGE family epimerase/isomerase [Niabella sp.]|nr:AGE family epimerase/isomerase [Niabella sp.]